MTIVCSSTPRCSELGMCCPRYPGKYRLFAVTNRRRGDTRGKWERKGRTRRRGLQRINRLPKKYFFFYFYHIILLVFFITDFCTFFIIIFFIISILLVFYY